MEVPVEIREDFAVFFGHLADYGMCDSPDGPWAEDMRSYMGVTELTPDQAREVVICCVGTIAFNRPKIDEHDALHGQRALVLGLALHTGKSQNVAEADQLMNKYGEGKTLPPHVESAHTIYAVLSLLLEG